MDEFVKMVILVVRIVFALLQDDTLPSKFKNTQEK